MSDKVIKKLASYKPSAHVSELIKATTIVFLVGPTGAGKDSLKEKLLKTKKFHHIVSHTTRKPRINHGILEVDGVDYHFIDKDKAVAMINNNEFIEVKLVHDNIYGTSLNEIKIANEQKKIAMSDIDVQGVREYKAIDKNVMAIFLLPPNFKIWQERLSKRYGDVVDVEDHKLRLKSALKEIDELLKTNYYIPLINRDLDKATIEVLKIVEARGETKTKEVAARKIAKQLDKDIRYYLNNH